MNKCYIFFFVLSWWITLTAQTQHSAFQSLSDSVRQAWVARYNGSANSIDDATAISVDKLGNVYVTGSSYNENNHTDFVTIKYNTTGGIVWISDYDDGLSEGATAIAVDDSGNVYVTGSRTFGDLYGYYLTIKYDSLGVLKWNKIFGGAVVYQFDSPTDIVVDKSGNVYVTGRSYDPNTGEDYATIKYNSIGTQEWVARYDNGGYDGAWAIALDDSGNVYVTGGSNGSGTSSDFATVKYNTDGIEKWVERYNNPSNNSDGGRDIVVDKLGNVYVTGTSIDTINGGYISEYTTLKYNSSGNQDWVAVYDAPFGDNEPWAIAIDSSNNIYVTGRSRISAMINDFATIKYNSDGTEMWVALYDGFGISNIAKAIAIDDSDNIYVTGSSNSPNTYQDYATVKYNPLGTEEWVVRYDGTAHQSDKPAAIAVDHLGNVYVTGKSPAPPMPYFDDYVTIKYEQGAILLLPLAPSNLEASIDTVKVSLTWNDNSDNEDGFVIERKLGDSTSSNSFAAIDTVEQNITAYTDTAFSTDTLYSYRVYAYNPYGNSGYSNIVTVDVPFPTGVKDNTKIPLQFSLEQNYPNPFNPTTRISWQSPVGSWQTLKVYDVLGREVVTLVNEYKPAGKYEVEFNASNLPSGIYFYSLQAGSFKQVRKMIIMK